MNYKDPQNKNDFLKFKADVINKLSDYIDQLANTDYKNSVNLVYWLKSLTNFLKREKNFQPKYLPVYKRGSIIFAEMGYNPGSEHGGLHYVIVLDKNDSKASSTLTVVPMASTKGKKLNEKFCFDLGEEFYDTLDYKTSALISEATKRINSLDNSQQEEFKAFNKELDIIESCMEKAKKLKQGGYALLGQITTISKMRIKEPTQKQDPLFDVILSEETMNNLSKAISNLYL